MRFTRSSDAVPSGPRFVVLSPERGHATMTAVMDLLGRALAPVSGPARGAATVAARLPAVKSYCIQPCSMPSSEDGTVSQAPRPAAVYSTRPALRALSALLRTGRDRISIHHSAVRLGADARRAPASNVATLARASASEPGTGYKGTSTRPKGCSGLTISQVYNHWNPPRDGPPWCTPKHTVRIGATTARR